VNLLHESKGSYIAPSSAQPPPPPTDPLLTTSATSFLLRSVSITRLQRKVDGETDHLFIAIIDNEAVGSVVATLMLSNAIGVQMLFVAHKHRHFGIATRLMAELEAWARSQRATQLELSVLKGNIPARQFWIRKCKFIDDEEGREVEGPRKGDYICMSKLL
jgi:GNAT superfamily N-acetyltransferase